MGTPSPSSAALARCIERWERRAPARPCWREASAARAPSWGSAFPEPSTGTSESRAIWDGRYIETLFKGDYNAQPFEGRSITGYDNLKGKYVATWIDSMSTGVFIAYGTHDAASKSTTYLGEMDDPMMPGKITAVRQVYRWIDPDHFVFEWYETHDGAERKSMEIKYARAK